MTLYVAEGLNEKKKIEPYGQVSSEMLHGVQTRSCPVGCFMTELFSLILFHQCFQALEGATLCDVTCETQKSLLLRAAEPAVHLKASAKGSARVLSLSLF